MGWDRKARGAASGYYYRSVRLPGRAHPVKQYLGRGAAAQEAAGVVEAARRGRQAGTAAAEAERAGAAEADGLADELRFWAEALAAAWLFGRGYHRRRGEWRLKRG